MEGASYTLSKKGDAGWLTLGQPGQSCVDLECVIGRWKAFKTTFVLCKCFVILRSAFYSSPRKTTALSMTLE